MSEENSNFEEFNERFETVEQALKYIADSQAKSEWLRKQFESQHKKEITEIRQLQANTQEQLDYITKLTGIVYKDLNSAGEKFDEIGKILQKK